MISVSVDLRNVEGTEAALGWASGRTIVVDRPEGNAGGMGLGFNGAQLLALSIGGCFCNDLRYAAHDLGMKLGKLAVSVEINLEGDPLVTTSAVMDVDLETVDGTDPQKIIDYARKTCVVSNSVSRGFPVDVTVSGEQANLVPD